uniref:tRNA selenocysteine-associated protein 1 n=1 Tax=Cacopsylla melanoneura TaxID=428564 RepID=A0A8D8XCI9_9HEMI
MSEPPSTQLRISQIEPYMTEFFLANAFIKMGVNPLSVRVVKKFGATPNDTTYGFVNFKSEKDTFEAYNKCKGDIIPNSNPPVRFRLNHILGSIKGTEHRNRDKSPAEYSVYVGDLDNTMDDMKLFKEFADKFKSLRTARIQYQTDGKSKGYGFLVFGSEFDHKMCLKTMMGHKINGKPVRVCPSRREMLQKKTPSVPSYISDAQFWEEFTSLREDPYPIPIPQDLLGGNAYDMPSCSRFYTKNDLELMEHEVKMDYDELNSGKSLQDHCLWDPLLESGYSVLDLEYNACTKVTSSC